VGSYAPVFERKPVEIETAPRRRRLWAYAAAGILCVAGAAIVWRAVSQHGSTVSIVVLPFTNLTADPANQYFADGITDKLPIRWLD